MTTSEDTLARTRWRGPVLLGLGVGLCTVGVLSACGGPVVVPYRAPTTPIVGLEPLEDGDIVASAATNNVSVWGRDDGQPYLFVYPGSGGDVFETGGVYSGSVAVGVERLELRAGIQRNPRGWIYEGGTGLRLPSFGRWTPVVDVATAYQDISDEYTQQIDTAEGIFEEEEIAYRYRVVAPSARARMVWQPTERLSVPVFVRWTNSRTYIVSGLESGRGPTENYLDVGAGAVYQPGDGCLQLGAGVFLDPRLPQATHLQASIACRGQLWGGAQ